MSEASISAEMQRALSRGHVRLFRNHVGTGWSPWGGRRAVRVTTQNIRILAAQLCVGDVVVPRGRILTAGLAPGSSDFIGWRSVKIAPEAVGRTAAIFVSLEGKSPRGSQQANQAAWLRTVDAAGGLSGVFRSVADAREILNRWP